MLNNDLYQSYIYLSRYARWQPEKNRRETWIETVDRYINYFSSTIKLKPAMQEMIAQCRTAILNLEVMPSMRCLMSAGKALQKDNIAGYNCSFVAIDDPKAFDEILYVLMCGTGVGFSVEKQYIKQLPEVPYKIYPTDTTIVVHDSRVGWATALRELIFMLFAGKEPKWDTSKLRPAGTRLITFGGRASGPGPLEDLFRFVIATFRKSVGRKLSSLEVHDIICMIASCVVSGGVRRSALISLSDLDDREIQNAKSGDWFTNNSFRSYANNSAVYDGLPSMGVFMQEWQSLYSSKSGERGIFNQAAVKMKVKSLFRRDAEHQFGTNPCGEIILRSLQTCNLTEVVVRPSDDYHSLKNKVELATILGTLQSTLTDFRYVRRNWKKNCEEERLLGVSLTGIYDNPLLYSNKSEVGKLLDVLRNDAIKTNVIWAKALGINKSTAITCVKPSGTVSQLVNSASGIHPRYSEYYIRRVRSNRKDPLTNLLIDAKVPYEEDVVNSSNVVFSFPHVSPENALTRHSVSAIDQLKLWLTYSRHWAEHKPSVTIYVQEDEWLDIGAFVYKHFNEVSGISFLPKADDKYVYKQAPYEEIDKDQYSLLKSSMPESIDWSLLGQYEQDSENIKPFGELACTAGQCEL